MYYNPIHIFCLAKTDNNTFALFNFLNCIGSFHVQRTAFLATLELHFKVLELKLNLNKSYFPRVINRTYLQKAFRFTHTDNQWFAKL